MCPGIKLQSTVKCWLFTVVDNGIAEEGTLYICADVEGGGCRQQQGYRYMREDVYAVQTDK